MTMQTKERRIFKLMAVMTVIMIVFSLWFWLIDPAIRPVLEFRNYDPTNIDLEKEVYSPGEEVWGYLNVCKLRKAGGSLSWSLLNKRIIPYAPKNISEFQVGVCFPEVEFDENGEPKFSKFYIATLPEDATNGDHFFVGVANNVLTGNRIVKNYYKTEVFNVIE